MIMWKIKYVLQDNIATEMKLYLARIFLFTTHDLGIETTLQYKVHIYSEVT